MVFLFLVTQRVISSFIAVTNTTNQIVMNCADIDIITASFVPEGGEEINATGFNYQNEDEKVTLSFPSALQKGSGTLKIDFVGELNDKMKGFYRSKYAIPSGEIHYAAVTQFENVIDRKPCPDDENLVEMKFARTPIMSTYLVAFVVGEYDYVETKSSDGVIVRVYTPLGKGEQGRFALEVAAKTLPFYKDYFNVPYPLPKIDLIAIADFAAGAMENWGLVTYRETALLIDPKKSCSSSRQWVALVEWWTHLWLNEGFASWIEYLCVDHCFPEYDIWTQFVSADYTRALDLDALDNSHPIEVNVGHPSEVDEIFDAISYSKGASVIRMLHDYIGDEDFRNGMNVYLLKFQHKNASTEDLWDSLEQSSGKPIAALMNSWTKQMGFPIILVEQEQQGDDRVLKLSQKKFCASGPYNGDECHNWMVPISICTSDDPACSKMNVLLDCAEITVTVKNVAPDQWVKARAGMISTVEVLKVMEAFVNEPNYTVWSDLSCNLGILSTLLANTDYHEEIQEFIRDLFIPIGQKLGWDTKPGEGHLDALLRGLVLGKLGKAGHKPTLEEARRRFRDHEDGKQILPADLRSPVYLTVLKHGDSTTLEAMLKEEVRPQDTVSVIGGVAGSSKHGRKAAWKFLSVDGFAVDKMAAEVKSFFESHPAPAAERTVQQCCENILLNAAWLKRDSELIHEYLLQRKAPPAAKV
ncbi:Puromycin-sensitive aminopeptidase [Acipenser ruthenus]|uniref:Puromycin-sensitive aminopeptidase n=1 Tax=Acipenser ruthenus TaxID=7906 RepID=A0A444UAE8_ACIRT|nr:Puromycin-sensitive aminopeptidase [Acipenser ruthenus]